MIEKIQTKLNQLPMNQIVEWLTAAALRLRASDIHFEAEEHIFKIRLRIDGVLEEIAQIPKELFLPVVAQIKELSGMKIEVHQKSQDGRFKIELPDNTSYDTRVSVIPSGYGESVIIRLLRPDIAVLSLEELGFEPQLLSITKKIISSANGILFVTGPTSAGKTTTLYAILGQLNKASVKIFTIEDPIEYRLSGIIQTQVNKEEGYTFLEALKSLLRQNPNIIMLGEVRDPETAQAAIQASLTGHFVLTTLHTNNAVEAIQRLQGLGVKPDDVTTSVRGIIAQRLVRRLCPDCCKSFKPDKEALAEIKKQLEEIPQVYKKDVSEDIKLYQSGKCDKCHQRGFKGQIGIFEILETTETIKKSILASLSPTDIEKQAQKEGMLTMYQDGLLKALKGVTALEEVQRATG